MKKILKMLLTVVMLTTCTITAHAASSELDEYPVIVHDWTTQAVFAAGTDWPITNWYLYAEDGKVLGSIPAKVVTELVKHDPIGSVQWEFWLADAFNDYRQTVPAKPSQVEPVKPTTDPSEAKESVAEIAPPAAEPQQSDAESLAMEIITLTNAKRKEHGLPALKVDNDLMELAMVRAKEVSTKYSHERPDGTRVVHLGYGENVGAKASPEKQVESWMQSEGHCANILMERYTSIGVGCYKAENGRTYWVQIFGCEASTDAEKPNQSDADSLALQAFDLINQARTENGLHELEINEDAMTLAQLRVPELEIKYDHTRPDGSRLSQTHHCGEIINRRASIPKVAVESWLGSPGHREMILAERYRIAGIACHKGTDGITYWCMLFCR